MTQQKLYEVKTFNKLLQSAIESPVSIDIDLIKKAYDFANKAHFNQKRLSGETYIDHLVSVAGYAIQLNLDTTTIVAALLHDSVEKANVDINAIDKEFGTEVAFIVDGLTNIQKLIHHIDSIEVDIENFKHLIFNATEDIRILIVRILEKYHNLQSTEKVSKDLITQTAQKVLNIYAPLSEYLGLAFLQRALEDSAFKVIKPTEYALIKEALASQYSLSQDFMDNFIAEVLNMLKKYSIKYFEVTSRQKGIYSTYKKAKRKSTTAEITKEQVLNLKDILAARILVDSVEQCYLVLGLVHAKWEFVKEDFDDYISKPKSNGYRSLQTIINYRGAFIEVQIRTKEMHEYNEFGPASHIIYKLKGSGNNKETMTWTKDLIKWHKNSSLSAEDFKINVFANSIFVFTPKGKIFNLDAGSTPIDFAFRVHTEIGYCYLGAKVNNKMVNMSYRLKTGDVVEILTSKKRNVSIDWVNVAKMSETKARIRRHFNILEHKN